MDDTQPGGPWGGSGPTQDVLHAITTYCCDCGQVPLPLHLSGVSNQKNEMVVRICLLSWATVEMTQEELEEQTLACLRLRPGCRLGPSNPLTVCASLDFPRAGLRRLRSRQLLSF